MFFAKNKIKYYMFGVWRGKYRHKWRIWTKKT